MKAIDWQERGLIPELLYFQNGGTFTGSVSNAGAKEFRYKLSPDGEKIRVEVWYGSFCYEKSEILDQSEFPLDESGRSKALDWLKKAYESMAQ